MDLGFRVILDLLLMQAHAAVDRKALVADLGAHFTQPHVTQRRLADAFEHVDANLTHPAEERLAAATGMHSQVLAATVNQVGGLRQEVAAVFVKEVRRIKHRVHVVEQHEHQDIVTVDHALQ